MDHSTNSYSAISRCASFLEAEPTEPSAEEEHLVSLGLGIHVPRFGYFDIDPARRLIAKAHWALNDWHALSANDHQRIVEAADAACPDDLYGREWGFSGDVEAIWLGQARMMRGP